MVPLKLELTNFLSYREKATVDFSDVQLACISGQNGAGKSSLLEAMTWALFGKSRSRSDDDVVNRLAAHQGERAEVRFTFGLEEIVYRVIRRKKMRGRTVLEFQIQMAGGDWSTLSETKIRETQATIEQTLNMNYDTFVNVSFFLQGQADAFTTKTAGQRKEILAELLGVNKWDAFKERATDKRKSAEKELTIIDAIIGDINTEMNEEAERKANLAAAEANLKRVEAQVEAQDKLFNEFRRIAEAAKQQKTQVDNLRANLGRERKKSADLTTRCTSRQRERDQHQQLLDQREAIERDFEAYQSAQAEFDQWQAKADEHNRLVQAQQAHKVVIEREQSRLQERRRELQVQAQRVVEMRVEREGVSAEINTRTTQLATLNDQLAEVSTHETAYQQARDKLNELTNARNLVQQEAAQLRKRAQEIGRLTSENKRISQQITFAQSELEQLTGKSELVAAKRTELADLQTRHTYLLTHENPRLKQEIDRLTTRLQRLEDEAEGVCPVCGRELTDAHRASVIAEVKREGAPIADDYRANKRTLKSLAEQIKAIETMLQKERNVERNVQAQQKQVATLEARGAEIGRNISEWEASNNATRLDQLEQQLADDGALQTTQIEVKRLQALVTNKSKLERAQQQQQRALSTREARLAEIERSLKEWEQVGEAQLARVTKKLDSADFEPEARAALAQLNSEITSVGYDAPAHESTRQARDTQRNAPKHHQQLKQAEAAVKPLDDTLADLARQIEEQTTTIETLEEQLIGAEAHLRSLVQDSADLHTVEKDLFRLREEKQQLTRLVGVAQQRVSVLDDQRERRKRLSADRADTTLRIQRLKLLEKACGRDGVQALLIERALPEIEDHANELLDRLTNGEMRVSFETQKKLKTSDELRETLDIHIQDGSGIRPYENYSGGEQFRINFAIRLALSRILSKRAGARLQTLVIDEGFGSQDPNGRQRLVEAINTIKDDFRRILVITHIDELREAFPTRIEVAKTRSGSQVAII